MRIASPACGLNPQQVVMFTLHVFHLIILFNQLVSESVLTGSDKGEDVITLAPGLQLWLPESNWKFRIGVGFPLTSDRENDFAVYFQFGNHFDWGLDF